MKHWLQRYNLLLYDEIDSTNEEARRLIDHGVAGKFIVVAAKQTKGKGRLKNIWSSPEGNLFLSIILDPKCKLQKAAELSFVAAVALGETLKETLPKDKKIELKWPNDVLVDGKKIAGILLESNSTSQNTEITVVIIGVGLNINHYPEGNDYPVTSVKQEGGKNLIPEYYLDIFIKKFDQEYDNWKKQGFKYIREKWIASAYNLNKVITASTALHRVSGIFEDISENGELIMRLSNGDKCLITSGSVFFENI